MYCVNVLVFLILSLAVLAWTTFSDGLSQPNCMEMK